MPGKDGTGPQGKGRGIGRRAGNCFRKDEEQSPGLERGLGKGKGGRGGNSRQRPGNRGRIPDSENT